MKYVLIKSRHHHEDISKLPAIFETVKSEQIFDFDYHKKIIHEILDPNIDELTLYVTGLTPLLISVVNYCRLFNINLILYHYNSQYQNYVAQTVV